MTRKELEVLRALIVGVTNSSNYDHRPAMLPAVIQAFPHMLDDEQLQYSRFKRAIAQVLKPRTIYEVGVGWGVSARAFMDGFPETSYFGLDSGEMGVGPNEPALLPPDRIWRVIRAASDEQQGFIHPMGEIDLIHIDGGHGRDQKERDVIKAFNARPEWILIDDFHDVMVASGTMNGIWAAARNNLSMLYFENSLTGSLLIHAGRREPEYRL